MTAALLALIDNRILNVNDISTVAPYSDRLTSPSSPPAGVQVTFMSKGTVQYFPGFTPDTFMDKLIEVTAKLDLPD